MAYWPGESFADGKLKFPFSSLTTVTVMVPPAFLALTSTPSMAASPGALTLPLSTAGACAHTGEHANAIARPVVMESRHPCMRMRASYKSVSRCLVVYNSGHGLTIEAWRRG